MEECSIKVGDHVRRTSSQWSSDLCSRYPGNESLDTVYEVLETRYDDGYYAVRGKNLDTGIEYGLTESNLIIVKSSSYSEDFLVKNLNWDTNIKSLKVGQKVKFRDIKWYKQHKNMGGNIIVNCVAFTSSMIGCCSREYTIESVNDKYIYLNGLSFTCDLFMFEKIEQQTEIPLDLNYNNKHLFVPGVKVQVRSLDWYNKYKNLSGDIKANNYYVEFVEYMKEYCGKTFTISSVNHKTEIRLNNVSFIWAPFMFEDIKETNKIIGSYKKKVDSNNDIFDYDPNEDPFFDDETILELTEDKEDYSMFVRKNKIKLINPKTENYE